MVLETKELTPVGMRFFPDMTTHASTKTAQFQEDLQRSLERCIGVTLVPDIGVTLVPDTMRAVSAFDRARSGLECMRKLAIHVYRRVHPVLIEAELPLNVHHSDYMRCCQGEIGLEELVRVVQHNNARKTRRDHLARAMEREGINVRVLKCRAIERYVDHGSACITLTAVKRCVLDHLLRREFDDTEHCLP
jgi:hypothetical protein